MQERIQKLLSQRGLCSRRQAESWILAGRVCCNGQPCHLGQTADPDIDVITVDGKPLPGEQTLVYIMLHKPRGYVTTLSDERGRKNAAQLITGCPVRVYPVGRLDMDSEGLLLFTNDGQLANRLMHPSHEIDKTYQVRVTGCRDRGLQRLLEPMELDGRALQTPDLQILHRQEEAALLQLTIHEGRNRQVRRMCAIAGMQVKRLIRVREGGLELGGLPVGQWRYLSQEEVQLLKKES